MMNRFVRSPRGLWLAAFAVVLSAILLRAAAGGGRAAGDTPGREETSTVRGAAVAPGDAPPAERPAPAAAPATDEGAGEPGKGATGDETPAAATAVAYPVDLQALRAKIPDNLYWQLGAPTEDEDVLAWREEEERRMNDLFGKVQSSAASEEEIHGYHDRRRQISEDYITFAKLVLEEHGHELPESDRGLYALSIEMHEARLRDLPRQVEGALARRKARVTVAAVTPPGG